MNDPATQQRIAELIEGCQTPRGGFLKNFFYCFRIDCGKHWTPPSGWKARLVENGSLPLMEASARAYHAAVARGAYKVKPARKPAPEPRKPENQPVGHPEAVEAPAGHRSGHSMAAESILYTRLLKRIDLLEKRVEQLELLAGQ